MKLLKVFPLVLFAAGLASGVVHAKGGNGGMGMGGGAGMGGMSSPGAGQRDQIRTQSRIEKHTRTRDGI